jgi:hypothetical protein
MTTTTGKDQAGKYARRAEGRRDALNLYAGGYGVRDIAAELDSRPDHVTNWLATAVVQAVPTFTADELRALQTVRLDQLTAALMPYATGDVELAAPGEPVTMAMRLEAARVVLDIERHRAALYGLAVPPVQP